MKLVIGGYYQGKLQVVLHEKKDDSFLIFDSVIPCADEIKNISNEKCIIINHFHLWVREQIMNEKNPEEEIKEFIRDNDNCVIISDEIGNGIVPIDKKERECRERTGRILVEIAKMADEVVRVVCGIEQKIK